MSLVLLLALSPVFSGGKMWLRVWDPYGKQVYYGERSFTDSGAATLLNVPFKDYALKYYLESYTCGGSSGSCNLLDTPYCRIGGWYRAKGHIQCNRGGSVDLYPISKGEVDRLYYCNTTLDLLSLVKVPASWQTDDMIIYCHNGGDNFFEEETFDDFVGPRLNTYKACIVKDLSRTGNNTVIFSLDVGNKQVDSDDMFYTKLSNHNRLLEEFTSGYSEESPSQDSSGSFSVTYKQSVFSFLERKYTVKYDSNSFVTSIYEGNEVPNVVPSVVSAVEGLSNIDKARVIVIKKEGNKNVYGYDVPYNVLVGNSNEDESPVYLVYFPGMGKLGCEKSLAYYVKSAGVECDNGLVKIYSRKLGNKNAYLLFMNLILDS